MVAASGPAAEETAGYSPESTRNERAAAGVWIGATGVVGAPLHRSTFRAWPRYAPLVRRRLPSLDKSWSFNDSWVTNVTVVGGLLAGIFGSSHVVKAILGEDADEAIALATIGGAVSVALIGAAGVVVVAARCRPQESSPRSACSSALRWPLGGGGQLGVVYESARDLVLGGIENDLAPFLVVALILLAVSVLP